MTLEDGQWAIKPVSGDPYVVLGVDTDYPVMAVSGRGLGPLRSRQYAKAGSDGIVFGREYRDGRTFTIEGTLIGQTEDEDGCLSDLTEEEAWTLILALEAAWDVPERQEPRSVVYLLEKVAGEADDRVYAGRPDRFDYDTSNIYRGVVTWVGTFNVMTSR